jgi:hypothetical protein
MSLFCRKDGKKHWNDKTVYDDGSFYLITKGPLDVDWCRCDSCNARIKKNQEAFLLEQMINPKTKQYSRAANYFNLTTTQCRICGLGDNNEVYGEGADSV